jgi:hypothetical protein
MEIEDTFDNIITNLKILSLLQVNEKLSIHKGHLQIDKIKFQCIKRWLNKSSRDIILIYLKELAKNINKLKMKDLKFINIKIFTEIEKAKGGLLNLQTTYANDPITVVKIDTILSKFDELNLNSNEI